jgi:hypothetical protein
VARRRRIAAEERGGRDERPARTRVLDDLLHQRDVEAARAALEGMRCIGDARDREAEHVAHGRVEVDAIRESRRVLSMHGQPDQVLAQGGIADRVLEPLTEATT